RCPAAGKVAGAGVPGASADSGAGAAGGARRASGTASTIGTGGSGSRRDWAPATTADAPRMRRKTVGRFMVASGSTCLPNANRVALRTIVHRGEAHGLRCIFAEDQRLPGGFIAGRETLGVLEHAADLNLDAAVLPVLDVRHDLQSAVRCPALLDTGTRDRVLHALVHEHEHVRVLELDLRRVLGRVGAWSWSAAKPGQVASQKGEQ